MHILLRSLPGILVTLLAGGCASPYSFHTGRTLGAGHSAFTVRVEDAWKQKIEWKDGESSVTIQDKSGPALGAGLDMGLPARLEAGLVFVPNRLEGGLRWQVNPRRSTPFDLALEAGAAHFIGGGDYLRAGGTVSAPLGSVEPYLHARAFHFLEEKEQLANFLANRTVGGGLSLRLGPVRLLPELDYSFGSSVLRRGFWQFGFGVRLERGRD